MKQTRIGHIESITRFPVKSMAGIELDESVIGWHGLAGDRRFGIRQVGNKSGFPWLTARKMPGMLLYRPGGFEESGDEMLPTQVQSPTGEFFELCDDRLSQEIGQEMGCRVEFMRIANGIFDDAPVSIIAASTISHVCNQAGIAVDSRRFRANIVVKSDNASPFAEDDWLGRVLVFGDLESAPAVHVTKRDMRCKMIGLDPDTAEHDSSVVKAVVELNENHAGVYGSVVGTGTVHCGDPVFLMES